MQDLMLTNKKNIINKNLAYDLIMNVCKIINECDDYNYIDMNDMGYNDIPSILINKINVKNIDYLFLSNNKITSMMHINIFENIKVIDISDNPIKRIEVLPMKLEELVVYGCDIEYICDHKYLKKIHCYNNSLKNINDYPELIDLICNNNHITKISNYKNLKNLSCKNNDIDEITNLPNLKYLECSDTKIKSIDLTTLEELICGNTFITDISSLINLRSLELCNTKIQYIPYIPFLEHLIIDNLNICIDPKYKIKLCVCSHDNLIHITFDNNQKKTE